MTRPGVSSGLPALFGKAAGPEPGKLKLARVYCQTARQDLLELDEAVRRKDPAVTNSAHRMKGAAQLIGAREVAVLASTIERLARQGRLGQLPALALRLRSEVAKIESYVSSIEQHVTAGSVPGSAGTATPTI